MRPSFSAAARTMTFTMPGAQPIAEDGGEAGIFELPVEFELPARPVEQAAEVEIMHTGFERGAHDVEG